MTADKNFKRMVRARARRTGESYASARRELLAKRPAAQEEMMNTIDTGGLDGLVEVTLAGMSTDSRNEPFLVLTDGTRRLPIFIGPEEARAIGVAVQQLHRPRPTTHDALKQAVDALDGRLLRVIVALAPDEHTYTTDVVLAMAGGAEQHLDWRVSDSVALAVRYEPRPPILAAESLLATPLRPAGAQVHCACGEWRCLSEEVMSQKQDSGHLDFKCPTCGLEPQVEIVSPRPGTGPDEGPARPT